MTDDMEPVAEESITPPVKTPAQIAGTLLRQAREAAGLHIAALAVSLKVPVKKLEALEAGRIDLLPDAVFVRAFAASICRTLKIDAAPILQYLPPTTQPNLQVPPASSSEAIDAPRINATSAWWEHLSRPVVIAALALVLGTLVLILIPTMHRSTPTSAVTPETPAAVAAPLVVAPVSVPQKSASAAVESKAVSASAPLANTLNTLLLAASSTASAPAAAGPQVKDLIVFKAWGSTWVKVTDAQKQVVMQKLLTAGEIAAVTTAVPVSVVVGRADGVQVQVRGRSFDLQAVTKENVARFEVK